MSKPVPQRKLDNSSLASNSSNNGCPLPTKPRSSVGGVAVWGPLGDWKPLARPSYRPPDVCGAF